MPYADIIVLPDTVHTVHYDLTPTRNFNDFTFAGGVNITVGMAPGIMEIVLNCAKIDMHTASVRRGRPEFSQTWRGRPIQFLLEPRRL